MLYTGGGGSRTAFRHSGPAHLRLQGGVGERCQYYAGGAAEREAGEMPCGTLFFAANYFCRAHRCSRAAMLHLSSSSH